MGQKSSVYLTSKKEKSLSQNLILLLAVFCCANSFGANSAFFSSDGLENKLLNKTIVLLASDVELYRLSQIEGKNTDSKWTQQAIRNINLALLDTFDDSQYRYKTRSGFADANLVKLIANQRVIEKSILSYFQFPLPSKKDFNWSIGSDGGLIKKMLDADYGLFVLFRAGFETETSDAKYQYGQASLVNLSTGRTVWFNTSNNLPGNLRDTKRSVEAIVSLFSRFPR